MRSPSSAASPLLVRCCGLLLLLAAGCAHGPDPQGSEPSPLDEPTPQRSVYLTLPRLGGGQVSLASLRGSPVLITLFATWDLRCQAEASFFEQLHQAHRDKGLHVLGIALVPPGKGGTTIVRTYVEVMSLTFDVLLARPEDLELVSALGLTRQVPRTLLLDRKGIVVWEKVGQTDFVQLRARLRKLLEA